MRLAIAAIAGALLVAAAAAWTWGPITSPTRAVSASMLVRQAGLPTQLPPVPREGRVLLSRAQLDQALATGALDRPTKSLLAVKSPLHFGDFAWNDTAIPAGPAW